MQPPSSADQFHLQQTRQRILKQFSTELAAFFAHLGYEMVETPFIQDAELFLTKAGDQIINRLFTFERNGRNVALRPEFTVSAASLYNMQHPMGDQVVRWQFHGAVFEDDPEAPHQIQRFTIGVELIGQRGVDADAEIIALSARGLDEIGVRNWRVQLGHIGLMRALLKQFNLDSLTERVLLTQLPALHNPDQGKAYVLSMLDQGLLSASPTDEPDHAFTDDMTTQNTQYVLDVLLDATQRGVTMGGRSRHDIVERLLRKRQRATERPQIAAALDLLTDLSAIDAAPPAAIRELSSFIPSSMPGARTLVQEWSAMIDLLLETHLIPETQLRLVPGLLRNWDYYTGMIFDIRDKQGLLLGGGGRYDELTRLVGGDQEVPAVGFAYYADTLAQHLDNQ